MTGSDSTAHMVARSAAGWRDIRTLGPLLLIVFGLVLVFAPMTTIGAAGSVGNAGVVPSKVGDEGGDTPGCPTQEQIDNLIEQRLAYEADPEIFVGIPMSLEDLADLVANCSCDEPHSSGGGQAGGGGIVDPILDQCDRPEVEPPAEPEEPEENEPPVEPEENEPPVEPEDHERAAPVAAEPSESEAAAPAPAAMDELPQTGNGGQIATTAVGLLLSALGVVLLVSSRRRAVTP